MSQEQALQYLQQGIAAAKARQNDDARRLLQNAIRLDPRNETAWLWLSSVAKDDKERLFCLKQLLAINPQNEMALKGLRALGVTTAPEAATPAESAAAASVTAAPKSTIPQPPPEKIAAAETALDSILARAEEAYDPYPDVVWTRKTRGRAGERAAFLYRFAVRILPVLIIVIVLVGAAAAFVAANPQVIALAPTWTPSPTPTNTPTPTPGFTPTPSPTPELTYTPTPGFDARLPRGSLAIEMTATPIYPRLNNPILVGAVHLIDQEQYVEVLPTLDVERQRTELRFDPNPYFYEAIAWAESGDPERAIELLNEALAREHAPEEEPLLQAGLAYVYHLQGDYATSDEYADQAIEGDPRLRLGYVIRAQNAIAEGDFDTAASVIRDGLDELPGDVNLWLMRGELDLARNQAADAQWDAAVALYIDPTSEGAYMLRARADVARGDYGLAVLHLQEYLFYYPGSIQGWTLLGQARALEGNFDLAVDAFSRAVNTEERFEVQVSAYLGRADIYMQRRQYAMAFDDYDTVLSIDEGNAPAREGRAGAAYRSGRFGVVTDDVDALVTNDPSRNDLLLLKARALIDGANPRNAETFQQALDAGLEILAGNFPENLPDNLRPMAYEYRARILFERGQYEDALNDVDRALGQEESGARHYWRGRILEARAEEGDLEAARREYEWVQLWGNVYSYPFLPDAIERLNSLEGSEE